MANQSLKYQSLGDGGGAEHSEAAAASAASTTRALAQTSALTQVTEQVALRFVDEFTQAPITSKRYRLELPDGVIEGSTDAEGYTLPIASADRARLIAWQIFD